MKNRSRNRFSTVEICRSFDISKSTLFRWEKEGLLTDVERDWRNWRVYSQANRMEIEKIIRRGKGKIRA